MSEWFFLSEVQWNFASDVALSVFCLGVSIYFSHRLSSQPYEAPPALVMAQGIALVSLFYGISRPYWAYVWYLRGNHGMTSPEAAEILAYSPLVSMAAFGITSGYMLHLSFFFKRTLGRGWFWGPSLAVWSVSVLLAKLLIP